MDIARWIIFGFKPLKRACSKTLIGSGPSIFEVFAFRDHFEDITNLVDGGMQTTKSISTFRMRHIEGRHHRQQIGLGG